MSRPPTISGGISAIIPTIGRAESLTRLLHSLAVQSRRPEEVIVADASDDDEVACLVGKPDWATSGLSVRYLKVQPPNAVRQRRAAIEQAGGDLLLLLDDDVVLEAGCLEEMVIALHSAPDVVAVTADFNNQSWPMPTRAWRFYLRFVLRMKDDAWQGRVVGPLLRFGYSPVPATPQPMEWLGAGNSLVRRAAYDQAGGFSDFFLHRCTMNEDVDLGLKLARVGRILFCPAARMAHHHAPGGRVSMAVAAEDDLYNRFLVLRRTCGFSPARTFGLVTVFLVLETASHFLGCVKRFNFQGFLPRFLGRLRGFARVIFGKPAVSPAPPSRSLPALNAR